MDGADGKNGEKRAGLLRHLPLAVIVTAAALGAVFLRDVLSFDTLSAHRDALLDFRDANYLATALAFVLTYVAVVALSLPGAGITSMTGGFLFGTAAGTPLNILAATIGATLIFLAARWGAGQRLAQRMDDSEGRVKQVKRAIDANQWEALFLIRLVPIVPFFVANLLPALFGVPLFRFIVSTALGIIPGALVFTSLGAGLSEVFAAGETPDLDIVFAPHILLPILGLAALAALPIVLKALRGRAL